MAKLDDALISKAATIVKKFNGDEKDADVVKAIASALKVSQSTAHQLMCYAEPVANPSLKIKATGVAIKKARDGQNLRWERIAARAGISSNAARQLYEEAGGDLDSSYTGRGKRPDGAPAEPKSKATGTKRGASAAKKGTAAKKAAPKKARTRAELAARRP